MDNATIAELLANISVTLSEIAIECLDAFLDIDASVKEPWTSTEQLHGRFDYIFMLDSFNDNYESTLCIGSPATSMTNLFDTKIELDEAKDAVSELANIFCAVLMDYSDFTDHFGILVQNPPQEAVTQAIFPRSPGIEGKIWCGDDWLYFGYSIRPNRLSVFDLL